MNKDKRIESICSICNRVFKHGNERTGKYCSTTCHQTSRKSKNIKDWLENKTTPTQKSSHRLKNGIRNYLLEQADYKCSQCGWNKINPTTNKCPLEIDHIDGDSDNCKPENLRVLCPNCHALTPTYKALNKGNANKKRLAYSQLI